MEIFVFLRFSVVSFRNGIKSFSSSGRGERFFFRRSFWVSLILRLSLYKNIELTRDHVVLLFLFFSCKYTGVVKYEILIHFVDIFYKSNILSR